MSCDSCRSHNSYRTWFQSKKAVEVKTFYISGPKRYNVGLNTDTFPSLFTNVEHEKQELGMVFLNVINMLYDFQKQRFPDKAIFMFGGDNIDENKKVTHNLWNRGHDGQNLCSNAYICLLYFSKIINIWQSMARTRLFDIYNLLWIQSSLDYHFKHQGTTQMWGDILPTQCSTCSHIHWNYPIWMIVFTMWQCCLRVRIEGINDAEFLACISNGRSSLILLKIILIHFYDKGVVKVRHTI